MRRKALWVLPALLVLGCLFIRSWRLGPKAGPLPAPRTSLWIQDRHGLPMGNLLTADGDYSMPVSLEDISPWMVLATLATEDKRFYLHPGVDLSAALRALWQNVRNGRVVSGASTVTEQLARALTPYPKTFWGKLREAWGALGLERANSKRDILESYFNTISYGNQCRGLEAASRRYFGVAASDLSLAQSAYLAAIPKSPSRYNPLKAHALVLERQKKVLGIMAGRGWIDPEDRRLSVLEEISILPPPPERAAPHLMAFLKERLGARGGRLSTSLDLPLQQGFQELLAAQLKRLAPNHVTNGALLAVDTATGGILAWVGSADFGDPSIQGQVDGVRAFRQPGSSLKPFLYGLAFSRGMTPSDLLLDEPTYTEGGFIPKNYDEKYHGLVRMRTALACSYNVPAIRLAEKVTAPRLLEFLRDCGYRSLDRPADHYGLGLALGDGEVTMLESAAAYAALARGGVWRPLHVLEEGEDPLEDLEDGEHRVLDEEEAYLVTSILSDNAARAGAFGLYSPLLLPFPFAAKTGTTKDFRDNWAVGYTPEWVVAVWVGNFDGTPMRHVSGITGAAPLLHDAAMLLSKKYPSSPFPVPPGIVEREVCSQSGLLPEPGCPDRLREVYDRRFTPSQYCRVHLPSQGPAEEEGTIIFPRQGDIFKVDPAVSLGAQALLLQARLGKGLRSYWKMDGRRVKEESGKAWWKLKPGKHRLELWVGEKGKERGLQTVHFLVVP